MVKIEESSVAVTGHPLLLAIEVTRSMALGMLHMGQLHIRHEAHWGLLASHGDTRQSW